MVGRTCAADFGLISSVASPMIDTNRQVPSPSASAWRIDLAGIGGPIFIVMRRSEGEAREALAHHLVEIGSPLTPTIAAERAANAVPAGSVAVVW